MVELTASRERAARASVRARRAIVQDGLMLIDYAGFQSILYSSWALKTPKNDLLSSNIETAQINLHIRIDDATDEIYNSLLE